METGINVGTNAKTEMREHIGDGVYLYFNGCAIEISVNDHQNPSVVTLEPEVLINLITVAKRWGFKVENKGKR